MCTISTRLAGDSNICIAGKGNLVVHRHVECGKEVEDTVVVAVVSTSWDAPVDAQTEEG